MICPKCESVVSDNLQACPFCGAQLKNTSATNNNSENSQPIEDIFSDSSLEYKNKAAKENVQQSSDQPEKETVNANNSSDNIHRRTTGFDPYSYPTFDPTTLPASQVKAQAQQKQQNENFVDHNTNTHSTRKEQNSFKIEYEPNEHDYEGPDILGQKKTSYKDENDDSMVSVPSILKNVGGSFKKAGNAVGRGFKKAGRGLSKVPPKAALIGIVSLLVIVLIVVFAVNMASAPKVKNQKLFPAIYFDSNKVVMLESPNAEDKHNIASSGVNSPNDVQYYMDASRVFYIKNNDLYTFNVKKSESSRVLRNVLSYAGFDGGSKVIASAQDGKIYAFNGKEPVLLASENAAPSEGSLQLVYGDIDSCALYIDNYDPQTSSGELYKVDSGTNSKLLLELEDGTKSVGFYQGKYIILLDAQNNALLYDLDGPLRGEFEAFKSSVELGKNSMLISYGDGQLAIFDGKNINDLNYDIASVIAVSEEENNFAYLDSDKVAYLYKNGDQIQICETDIFSQFIYDTENNTAYGLEEDVLYKFELKSDKFKSMELGDGIEKFAKDEISGKWVAYGNYTAYAIEEKALKEVYVGCTDLPGVSSDGKNYIVKNESGELIMTDGSVETPLGENVGAYSYDSKLENILFVSNDKLYYNDTEQKITNVRDAGTFAFIKPQE